MMPQFTEEEIELLDKVNVGLVEYDNIDHELYDRVFEYFLPQMPYGTAKARTGDPHQWITDHLGELVASWYEPKCNCECHEPGSNVMHFMPCC